MLGINGYELIILVVLALVILGPERLPQYAQTLAEWVRKARGMAEDAKQQFKDETGTDFDDVDWKKYDPRQYDPRRIIREALSEEVETTRRAVDGVKDAARIEAPRRGAAAAGSRAGSPPRSGSPSRPGTRRGSGSPSRTASSGSARRAGTAGAARRAESPDPREVFGSGEGRAASGALAAGLAGAAVAGPVSDSADAAAAEAAEPAEAPQPAPFDVDAT